jgi:hypothetical protein
MMTAMVLGQVGVEVEQESWCVSSRLSDSGARHFVVSLHASPPGSRPENDLKYSPCQPPIRYIITYLTIRQVDRTL